MGTSSKTKTCSFPYEIKRTSFVIEDNLVNIENFSTQSDAACIFYGDKIYSNLFRMVILPFVIVWVILNTYNGYFNEIFYGILLMNWVFGFFILFLSRALMIKTFKEQKKVFFVF